MEKLKTLTIGGVTYQVCAPLTQEEKQEVTDRVLEGISYEQILAPHKQDIAQQAAQDVEKELQYVTQVLTTEDFTPGGVAATNGRFQGSTSDFAATPLLWPCDRAAPFQVTAKGKVSSFNVFYYDADGAYLGCVATTKSAVADLCVLAQNKAGIDSAQIAFIRLSINFNNNKTAVTAENLATVVQEFTFTRRYWDPITRQSRCFSLEKAEQLQQQLEVVSGRNLICTVQQKTAGDITVTHVGGGSYAVSQVQSGKDVSLAIYDNANALPERVERGRIYRFGGDFPEGVSMKVLVYAEGCDPVQYSLSRQHTRDVAIPIDATGLGIYLFFNGKYAHHGKTVYTEMIDAHSGRYASELVKKHHPGTDPAPMLTIIDDDGYLDFRKYLLPIIIGQEAQDGQPEVKARHIPIASAVPVALIEPEGQTRPGKSMSWSEIEDCALSGAEILSHTYNNIGRADVEQQNMTLEQIAYDYRLAQSHLQHHGIPAEGLVFVKDSSNVERCVEACKQVYHYGFKADSGTNEVLVNYAGNTDPYGILRNGATFYTADALKFMIDQIAGKTGWLVWMLHTSDNKAKIHDVVRNAEGQAVGITELNEEAEWPAFAPQLAEAIDYALENGVQIVSTKCGFAAYCR